MHIGILLPAHLAVAGPGNGIRASAVYLADAYEKRGARVDRLNAWDLTDMRRLDVLQFFLGGPGVHGLLAHHPNPIGMLAWSPVIDSNEPNRRYRLATRLGEMVPKVFTIPSMFREQALAAEVCLARSSYERRRLIEGLGVPPGKVEVVLLGVNPPESTTPDLARRSLDLPDEFALHVSSFTQGRKNAVALAEAAADLGVPLVLAGSRREGPTLDRLRELAGKADIRILDFLDRPVLESLFSAARVFCLPSLHEGVGLAALEAAAHGVGVMITERGGPPDYMQNLAQLVNPTDPQDLRAKLRAAWDNPRGDRLRDHVLNELTWDNSAAAHIAAFERHAPAR